MLQSMGLHKEFDRTELLNNHHHHQMVRTQHSHSTGWLFGGETKIPGGSKVWQKKKKHLVQGYPPGQLLSQKLAVSPPQGSYSNVKSSKSLLGQYSVQFAKHSDKVPLYTQRQRWNKGKV